MLTSATQVHSLVQPPEKLSLVSQGEREGDCCRRWFWEGRSNLSPPRRLEREMALLIKRLAVKWIREMNPGGDKDKVADARYEAVCVDKTKTQSCKRAVWGRVCRFVNVIDGHTLRQQNRMTQAGKSHINFRLLRSRREREKTSETFRFLRRQ